MSHGPMDRTGRPRPDARDRDEFVHGGGGERADGAKVLEQGGRPEGSDVADREQHLELGGARGRVDAGMQPRG